MYPQTANLSTPLRSGRDDKVGVITNQAILKLNFSSPWVGRRPISAKVRKSYFRMARDTPRTRKKPGSTMVNLRV